MSVLLKCGRLKGTLKSESTRRRTSWLLNFRSICDFSGLFFITHTGFSLEFQRMKKELKVSISNVLEMHFCS